jgi:hypothetical protein
MENTGSYCILLEYTQDTIYTCETLEQANACGVNGPAKV